VQQEAEGRRVETRWGWLVVSLSLMALSGFFLYPSVESFTESHPARSAEIADIAPAPEAPSAPAPKALPLARVIHPAKVRPAPPIPIRQVAPTVAEGIRNRIHGVIPVNVTIQIGKNGKVEHAEAVASSDAVRSHLAKEAVRAVKHWKFRPVTVGQKPVRTKWIVSFRFRNSQDGTNWRLLRPSS
jgi:TonB family protein